MKILKDVSAVTDEEIDKIIDAWITAARPQLREAGRSFLARVAHEVTARLDESTTESTEEAVIESPVVAPEVAERARAFAKLDQEVWRLRQQIKSLGGDPGPWQRTKPRPTQAVVESPKWRPEWRQVWVVVDVEEGATVYTDEDMADNDAATFAENNGGTPALKVGPFDLRPCPTKAAPEPVGILLYTDPESGERRVRNENGDDFRLVPVAPESEIVTERKEV